jgi:integrase
MVLRAGELHALRWHHIDFAKGEVKVETRVDAFGEEDVTKTTAGMRVIPLAQSLLLMLKEWKLRTKRKKAGDVVFPNDRGSYTNHDNIVKRKFLPLFDLVAKKYEEDPHRLSSYSRAAQPRSFPRLQSNFDRRFSIVDP